MVGGGRIPITREITEILDIPVIGRGRINDPILAEKVVADGSVDLVGLARAIIADPDFPRKMQEGRRGDIRKCIGCDVGCADRLFAQRKIRCAVNFDYGREDEAWAGLMSTKDPKDIAVIGGGPAGMESARGLAYRGHNVTLYEKSDSLGGLVLTASAIPYLNTRDLRNALPWQKQELDRAGVTVIMNKEISPEDVETMNVDAVILATDSEPAYPAIPGVQLPNVVHVYDYINKQGALGKKVVVIGGAEGAEAAVSIAREGHAVTVIEENLEAGAADYIYPIRRSELQEYLGDEKVEVLLNTSAVRMEDDGVAVTDSQGDEKTIEADTVVIAYARKSNGNALVEALRKKGIPNYSIGDCNELLWCQSRDILPTKTKLSGSVEVKLLVINGRVK
ncbi:FAD-dependent oxidoreductase [Metallumcola ferriviriculae]|uniref:FAD-dependent oxidoreductase n=1 Tax=Metallumcola ferriviriculae TaxID=3039180 RepID=A0AAU0UPR2_9FIRM|nr:FAD-dependent oxidoreductase [Desulfitibacteraceae bacterium MK1]